MLPSIEGQIRRATGLPFKAHQAGAFSVSAWIGSGAMCRDKCYDDLEKQLLGELLDPRNAERDARMVEFAPLIERERRPGSFSHAYARGRCNIPSGCTDQVVEVVCDAVENAIRNGHGPLSKANLRSYLKAALRHEATRWHARQMRFVSLDAPGTPALAGGGSGEPDHRSALSDDEVRALDEFHEMFIRYLIPADRQRPVEPDLCEVLRIYLSLQIDSTVRTRQKLSLNHAIEQAAPLLNLDAAGTAALNRAAYRQFNKARDRAFKAVPAAPRILKKLFGGNPTPTRLGYLFHCMWQRENEIATQGGTIPFIYTARSG
jgi:hypothetical protein